MSWSVSGLVDEGNTDALEHVWNSNREANPASYNASTEEQFEFLCSVVSEAYEAGVVEGPYSVSCSGHSDPGQENDRKWLSLSFSPVTLEYANQQKAQAAQAADDSDAVEGLE